MFSLRLSSVLVLAALIPVGAAAQDVAALQHRLAQLDVLKRTALAAAVRAESTSHEPWDTVAAGALRVVSRPADGELVRRAAAIAWARLDTLYGDAAAALVSEPVLFFSQSHPISNRPEMAHLPSVMAPDNATPVDVAYQLARMAGSQLAAPSDTALKHWLGSALLIDAPLASMNARVYVELVTAPSRAVHRCYAADLEACAAALGLSPPGVDRVTTWYDPAERRAIVRQTIGTPPGIVLRPAVDACVLSGSDSACLDVLRAANVAPPLSSDAPQTLARLVMGSDRTAFARLTARRGAGEPLPARLAAAARQPLDSLIGRWRAKVMAARPRPVTFAATIGWTALGWTLIFGFLALRSTRWR